MTAITIPSLDPNRISVQLVRPGDSMLRLMNGKKKYIIGTDPEFRAVLAIQPLTLAESKAWKAAFVQLAKAGNNFKLPTIGVKGLGSSAGLGFSPLVKGASQLGTSLLCDGVTASSLIALSGDGLEVNGEFKILTADANSNGVNEVTFNFEPALRNSPADNAAVQLDKPEITMALDSNVAAWAIRQPEIVEMNISAFEDY